MSKYVLINYFVIIAIIFYKKYLPNAITPDHTR